MEHFSSVIINISIYWYLVALCVGFGVCSSFFIPSIKKESILLKVMVGFLLAGCLSLVSYGVMVVGFLNAPKNSYTYEQKIIYATEVKTTKNPGFKCRFFVSWKNKETNDWLQFCITKSKYEEFQKNKELNAKITVENNVFGSMIKRVDFLDF